MRKIKHFLRNLQWLANHRISSEFMNQKFIIKDEVAEDMLYQYEEDLHSLHKLDIKSRRETVKLLMDNPKSYVRFGEGEIFLMQGIDQPFQRYNERLAKQLINILEDYHENLYVGVCSDYFHSYNSLHDESRKYYRLNGTDLRRFLVKHCNKDNIYIDACFTMAYFHEGDDFDFEGHYESMLGLFENKKILLVSGEGVFEKLEFDVFQRADDKRIIHAPSKNAYDVYDELKNKIISEVKQDELVCMILGMAGKALTRELSDMGYMVWDSGHMAKDYDAYKRGVERTTKNVREFYEPD